MESALIPEGFELESSDTSSSLIPEGFELDATTEEPVAKPVELTKEQPVEQPVVEQPKGAFARFMDSLRTTKPTDSTIQPVEDVGGSFQEYSKSGLENMGALVTNFTEEPVSAEYKKEHPYAYAAQNAVAPFKPLLGAAQTVFAAPMAAFQTISRPVERVTGVPSGVTDILAPVGLGSKAAKATDVVSDVTKPTKSVPVLDTEVTKAQELAANNALFEAQQEALGQVALGARSPFTVETQYSKFAKDGAVDLEGTRAAMQDVQAKDFERIQQIDDDLKVLATDTATPGVKERIAELQQEKNLLQNPKATGTKSQLSDEAYKTNIEWPVQNALSSGAPLARVEEELRGGLSAANVLPEEIDNIVERAIPQAYRQADDLAKDVSATQGLPEDAARGIIDVNTPDDGSIVTNKPIELKGAIRSRVADSTNMLSLISKQWAMRNNKDLGSASLRELDDFTAQRNLSQQGSSWWRSIIGNPNGSDKGILRRGQGSELVVDDSVDNIHAAITKAKAAGMSNDEMQDVINVYNAYDDYANIDRIVSDAQTRLQSLQGVTTKAAKEEAKELQKVIQEYTNKETFMPRADMQAGVQKYASNPAAKAFLDNKNKINRMLLDESVKSGLISSKEANRLLETHPNYAPAWREVEDFTFADVEVSSTGNISKPFKFRKLSSKESLVNPIEAITNNTINTIRRVEQAKFRSETFDHILKNATDEDFLVMFRENKEDVLKAINSIRNGGKQKWAADEITPTDATKVQKVGNITFPVGGGRIQLTVKDRDLFQELSQSRMWQHSSPFHDALVKMAVFTRNFITLNPEFSIRNLQRESMDSIVGARTSFLQKLKSPVQNVANIFAKNTKPELYEYLVNNMGYGTQRGQGLVGRLDVGKVSAEVADDSLQAAKFTPGGAITKAANKIAEPLEQFANRFDMAPRISVYEWTLRDGLKNGLDSQKAHEAALFAAKNLGVNFTQRGSNTGFDKVIRVIPFSRSFINSTDRLLQLGRYEPTRIARNTFFGLYVPYVAVTKYNEQFTDENGVPFQDKLDPMLKKDIVPIYGPWSENENDYFPLRLGWVYGRALPAMDKSLSYLQQEVGSGIQQGLENDIPQILANNKDTKNLNPKEVMAAWGDYISGIVSPGTIVPPGARQMVELGSNQDYLGREIVPNALKDSPAYAQYKDSTPIMLRDFSYALNKRGIQVSPIVAEYLVNSIFSSAGNYAMQAGDLAYAAATGREKPALEGKDMPFFNLISGAGSDVPREGVEAQFSNLGKYLTRVDKEYQAIIERTKTDPNAFNDLQQFEIENAEALAYYQEYKDIASDIKPLREMQASIAGAPKNELQGYQTPETELLGDPKKRKSINDLRKTSIEAQRVLLKKIRNDPNAEEIWYERLTRTPITQGVERVVDTITRDSLDKQGEKEYNNSFSSEDGQVMIPDGYELDTPPAIVREAPDLSGNDVPYAPGFFEKYLPNVRNEVVNKYKNTIVDRTLKLEGGFVNNPRDNGGATNYGVTLETYRKVNPKATVEDLKNMSKDEAKKIYTDMYWDSAKVDNVPLQLQDLVFDGNIHHGVSGMTRIIQRALNDLGAKLDVDGKMGNKTLNELNRLDPKVIRSAILKRRESLYKAHEDFDVFGKGWMNRLSKIQEPPKEIMES